MSNVLFRDIRRRLSTMTKDLDGSISCIATFSVDD